MKRFMNKGAKLFLALIMVFCFIMGDIYPGTAEAAAVANVNVDCSIVKPNYVNLAAYNNLNPRGAVDYQINDFASYNTRVVRYFSLISDWFRDQNNINSLDMAWFDQWYNKLDQAELYSDAILMPIKSAPACLSGAKWNASQFESVLRTGIIYMKQKYGKLEYITCWNEPNHPDGAMPNGSNLNAYMQLYGIFESVVNYVNANVNNGPKLKLGGPITAGYQTSWIQPFIQNCRTNNRKLDFVTWNYYGTDANVGESVNQTYTGLNTYGFPNAEVIISEYGRVPGGTNFSPTATQLAQQMAMVASAGYQYIAAGAKPMHWINEHSANYEKNQYGYDFLWNSGTTAGLETYDFTNTTARYIRIQGYGNQNNNYTSIKEIQVLDAGGNIIPISSAYAGADFDNIDNIYDGNTGNWWECDSTWKRQVTLDLGANKPIESIRIAWKSGDTIKYKFAVQASTDDVVYKNLWNTSVTYPFGWLLKMQNMLGEDARVNTTSDQALSNGQGVRAVATKNNNKVAILIWNYQDTGNTPYTVNLNLSNLPSGFAGKNIKIERYIAGVTHSNYVYNGTTSLEKPTDTVVASLSGGLSFVLAPNDVSCIVLTPSDSGGGDVINLSPSNDAYVRDGSYANANFGSELYLDVKDGAYTDFNRRSYLKFPINSLGLTGIASAKLRIYAESAGGTAVTVCKSYNNNNDWGETTITWSNQPGIGSSIGSFVANTAGQYYEIDITSHAQDMLAINKTMTLVIVDAENTKNYFSFRSNNHSNNRPVLVITEQ